MIGQGCILQTETLRTPKLPPTTASDGKHSLAGQRGERVGKGH